MYIIFFNQENYALVTVWYNISYRWSGDKPDSKQTGWKNKTGVAQWSWTT